jgi:hypothetical protein
MIVHGGHSCAIGVVHALLCIEYVAKNPVAQGANPSNAAENITKDVKQQVVEPVREKAGQVSPES